MDCGRPLRPTSGWRGQVEFPVRHSVKPPVAVDDTLVQRRKVCKQGSREVGLSILASRALRTDMFSQQNTEVLFGSRRTWSVTVAWTFWPLYWMVTFL